LFERIVQLSAPGSRVAVESFRGAFDVSRFKEIQDEIDPQKDSPLLKMDITGLFYTDERADPEQWLAERGWAVRPWTTLELAVEYGVEVPELSPELEDIAKRMIYFSAVLPS
jgi:O-methyltransferase involved in polyketide biosynthesis